MSAFYTNVSQYGSKILLRGVENGVRFKRKVPYSPYLFVPSKMNDSPYRTIEGKKVDRIDFETMNEAREFMKTYENVGAMPIHSPGPFTQSFIFDNYPGTVDYDPQALVVANLDIEVDSEGGFQNIETADKEITAITLASGGNYYAYGFHPYTPKERNVYYFQCKDEVDLLLQFLDRWSAIDPDVITGWNITKFDIPYLIRRIRRVVSDDLAKKLSPWRLIREKTYRSAYSNKEEIDYELVGIANLDYLELYRKFTYSNQESYKLDYIAEQELGEKKIDYKQYGTLHNLYAQNFELFIDYNIHDVRLVEKLDDKLKMIELVYAMAYDAKANLVDAFTSVRFWETIINNYLMERMIVPPIRRHQSDSAASLRGAFVKDPKLGLSKWTASFDLNSLYPRLIMMYNISPDTFVKKLSGYITIDDILDGAISSILPTLVDNNQCITANLCVFDKDRHGFLPELMEKMYNDRVVFKKKMIESKRELEEIESEIKRRGYLER